MRPNVIDEQVQSIIVTTDNQEKQEQETDLDAPPQEIQDIYVLIVREREEAEDATFVVESTPDIPQKTSFLPAYTICGLYLFCIFATIAFQLYCIGNPPIATVTIVPKSQEVTLTGTVQLGQLLNTITISQSQTVPTTGRGYQDARAATGTVTFYNGQQNAQAVAQGTVFTGRSRVSIKTTQQATIPPGNPGTGYGTVTITAQAVEAGSKGNIQAGDVNTPIALAVFVNNSQFTGGQNARDFSTVSLQDINKVSTPLKKAVVRNMQAALQGQLQTSEQLQLLPCTPTVTSDHRIGQEATTVKVTVSQTCSAIVYNGQILEGKAITLLAARALQTTGAGYSLFGTVHVSVKQASVTSIPHTLVFLSFQAQGIWIYALSQTDRQHIKELIADKTKQQALQDLASLSGIEHASIRFSGIGDPERVPKNTQNIHLVLSVS